MTTCQFLYQYYRNALKITWLHIVISAQRVKIRFLRWRLQHRLRPIAAFYIAVGQSVTHGKPMRLSTRETPAYWHAAACDCHQLSDIERTGNTITGTLFGHPWVVVIDTL